MSQENENTQPDRITYSESRSINIGNYESHQVFLSYGFNIKPINRVDHKATTQYSETVEFDKADFKNAVELVVKRVKTVLDARERAVRKATEDYVDFDTLAKAPAKKD